MAAPPHEDVPGERFYGLEIRDQPVLAVDRARHQGEPVALVAADHPRAGRAAEATVVDYEVREAVVGPRRAAFAPRCPAVHERGDIVGHQPLRGGSRSRRRWSSPGSTRSACRTRRS